MGLDNITDPKTGQHLSVFSQKDLTDDELNTAILSFKGGKSTTGIQILDVTPERSIGERAGRAVGRGSRAIKRGIVSGLESPFAPPRSKVATQALKFGAENLPLPESLADVGADVGIAATTAATGGAGVIPTLLRTLGPGLAAFLGGKIEGRPTSEAAGQAGITTAAAGAPELFRSLRGISKRLRGAKTLQAEDVKAVTQEFQRILPEGAPRLPTRTADLRRIVDPGKGSLPEFSGKLFKRRLDEIEKLAGNTRVDLPSLSDQPVTVREAIDAISGKGLKLPPAKAAVGAAKQTAVDRNKLIDELAEALEQPTSRGTGVLGPQGTELTIGQEVNPQNKLIFELYNRARSEFRNAQDVIRLLQGSFSDKTKRLDFDKLQKRFLDLREQGKINPANIDRINDVLSRGSGTLGSIDQPRLSLIRGLFSRSGVVPGVSATPDVAIPSFVGRTGRSFAGPISPVTPIVSGTLGQKLRNSPFEVQ